MKALLIAAAMLVSMGMASQADAGCWFPGKRAIRAVKNRRIRPARFVLKVIQRVRPGVIIPKR